MRLHSLIDIYRDTNKDSNTYTYKDKTGAPYQMSRIDYFLVDQETGAYTTKAKIEEICHPFDHSQITLEVDFYKVMRGPGFWKFNNYHLENPKYIILVKLTIVEIVNQYQQDTEHPKTEDELSEVRPEELQNVHTTLKPTRKNGTAAFCTQVKNYRILDKAPETEKSRTNRCRKQDKNH